MSNIDRAIEVLTIRVSWKARWGIASCSHFSPETLLAKCKCCPVTIFFFFCQVHLWKIVLCKEVAFYLQSPVLLQIYCAEYWSPSCLHLLKFFAQWFWATANIRCVFWLWCNCISSMWQRFSNENLVLSAWKWVGRGLGYWVFFCVILDVWCTGSLFLLKYWVRSLFCEGPQIP